MRRSLVTALLISLLTLPVLDRNAAGAEALTLRLFTEPEFAGTEVEFRLVAGSPFLAVPELGPGLARRVGSLQMSGKLGVLFFTEPFFAGRDSRCGLKAGEETDETAWWRGRTAEALLGEGLDLERPVMRSSEIASLLLFRRDLGPPPAALLLSRRSYFNTECGDSLNSSYYNRIVLPAPEAPGASYCRNLSALEESPAASGKPPSFRRADELLFLRPHHLDAAYPSAARHKVRVELFPAPSCEGATVALYDQPSGDTQLRLSEYGINRSIKSFRVSYEGGAWASLYQDQQTAASATALAAPTEDSEPSGQDSDDGGLLLAVPKVPEVATPETKEPTVATAPQPTPEAAVLPATEEVAPKVVAVTPSVPEPLAEAPAVSTAPEPEPEPEPEAAPATEPLPDDGITLQPPLPPAPASLPDLSSGTTASADTTQPSTTLQVPSASPEPAQTTTTTTTFSGGSGTPTVAVVVPVVPVIAPQPAQDSATAVEAVLPTQTSAAQATASQSASIVSPELANQPGVETFRFPAYRGYRLNFCLDAPGGRCGDVTANQWCEKKGFSQAASWKRERNVGSLFPTILMENDGLCDKYLCDGFEEILCAP